MTEETRDPKLSARYRELGADQPPRRLDEAILAASRRAVQSHPAPLVAPSGRRAWFVPLAAAAVLVLAVAVTLHMQLEQTGGDGIPAPAERARIAAPVPAQPEAQSKMAEAARQERVAPAPAARTDAPARSLAKLEEQKAPQAPVPKPFVADPVVASSPQVPAAAPQVASSRAESASEVAGARPESSSERMRSSREAAESSRSARADRLERRAAEPMARSAPAAVSPSSPASPSMLGGSVAKHAGEAADTPEKELERIALLRREGKHEDADKALAEFRKRFPDFRIPAPMLERVERR